MNRKYTDSLFPWRIEVSFIIILLSLLLSGIIAGLLLKSQTDQYYLEQSGGVVLLFIILVFLVGPSLFIRRVSRFERERTPLKTLSHFGTIKGFRGTYIKLLLYEDGLEIRAFFHRYFIPFDAIGAVSVDKGFFDYRLEIKTGLKDVPGYLAMSDVRLPEMAAAIQEKIASKPG